MAKTQEQAQEIMAQEIMGQETTAAAEEMIESVAGEVVLALHRKTFTHEGKTYNSFYIPIKVLGREIEIQLAPKEGDRNAYLILGDIFGLTEVADLVCAENTMVDGKKRTTFMSYHVRFFDENSGFEISVALKPVGDSNKRLLEQLYRQRMQNTF